MICQPFGEAPPARSANRHLRGAPIYRSAETDPDAVSAPLFAVVCFSLLCALADDGVGCAGEADRPDGGRKAPKIRLEGHDQPAAAKAFSLTASASRMRISPEISFGNSASRRVARVRDS